MVLKDRDSRSKNRPSNLRDIEVAAKYDLEASVQDLSEIILRHQAGGLVGLSRNHKHFDLGPNEQVVQEIRRLRDSKKDQFVITVQKEDSSRIPYMWCLSSTLP